MIKWSRTRTWIAGIGLIAIANAVALTGVAYSRSGNPDSMLRLSQRELRVPRHWSAGSENSGIALALEWQALSSDEEGGSTFWGSSRYNPAWLDAAKLAMLGFDIPDDLKAPHPRTQSREILLVLEFDGPARQKALERAKQMLTKEEEQLAISTNKQTAESRVKSARAALNEQETKSSRLFAIDAGLDLDALRSQYPDRLRYAIVHTKVQARIVQRNKTERMAGYISELHFGKINVPHQFQRLLGQTPSRANQVDSQRSYEFDIAFGKKLEPWIVDGRKSQDSDGAEIR